MHRDTVAHVVISVRQVVVVNPGYVDCQWISDFHSQQTQLEVVQVPSKHFSLAIFWAECGPNKISLGKVWLVHGYGIPDMVHTSPKYGTPNKKRTDSWHMYGLNLSQTRQIFQWGRRGEVNLVCIWPLLGLPK
jgi:hypothetical protein